MNAVIDTNVLVSSLLSKVGNCATIMYKVLNYELVLLYDQRILSEYEFVLKRPKFNFTEYEINSIIDFIVKEGISIVASPSNVSFDDESDKKFYEVFKSRDSVLITGNKKHFPKDDNILSPKEYLQKF